MGVYIKHSKPECCLTPSPHLLELVDDFCTFFSPHILCINEKYSCPFTPEKIHLEPLTLTNVFSFTSVIAVLSLRLTE